MRRRFFVEQFQDNQARLVGEAAHHLARVLRAQPGQAYELSDGQRVRLARVERVEKDLVTFALGEEIPARAPKLRTTLLLAIVKFDRFEWAIEKATELGVAEIVPVIAERSEKALSTAANKRSERWERVVLESAQQARRLRPPKIAPVMKCVDALRRCDAGLKLLLSEERDAAALRTVLADRRDDFAAVAIGPEGGWTEREFKGARACGFVEASLGQNILRTETAVVAALASLQYALGD